ncbi:hypothetical protein LIER_34194 [Lithospermum erythrorhizon]|uniref:Uncharacterized protein n=1 Tax=Lithospermum erythrorhizon TaxID=34254 RepID=A0AAV3RYT9_LITER
MIEKIEGCEFEISTSMERKFSAGGAARPGKVIHSALRYNCGVAAVVPPEIIDQRRDRTDLYMATKVGAAQGGAGLTKEK